MTDEEKQIWKKIRPNLKKASVERKWVVATITLHNSINKNRKFNPQTSCATCINDAIKYLNYRYES